MESEEFALVVMIVLGMIVAFFYLGFEKGKGDIAELCIYEQKFEHDNRQYTCDYVRPE